MTYISSTIGIVGAGIAGLTTGYRLMKAGIKSIIFEASGRVGGRILTSKFGNGQTYELGAEFIDSNQHELISLINELGLELINVGSRQDAINKYLVIDYDLPGNPLSEYDNVEIFSDYQRIFPLIQKDKLSAWPSDTFDATNQSVIELDQISLGTYVDTICSSLRLDLDGHKSKLAQVLKVVYATETGIDPYQQSSLNLILLMGFGSIYIDKLNWFGPSDETYKIKGGTQQLTDKLAKILTGSSLCEIKLNSPISCVSKNNDHYQLIANKQKYEYVYVIMTIPFQVYDQIDYSQAEFPPLRNYIINNAKLGCCTKFVVQLRNKFWVDNVSIYLTDNEHKNLYIYDASNNSDFGTAILIFYLGDTAAKTFNINDKQIIDELLDNLKIIHPNFDPKDIIGMDAFNWFQYKWCKGAYSIYHIGQYAFAGKEGRIDAGNCFFIGENCNLEHQGYMNGAVITANNVVSYLLYIINLV